MILSATVGASRRATALASAMVVEKVVDRFVGGAFHLAVEVVFVPCLVERQGVEAVFVPGVPVADVGASSERGVIESPDDVFMLHKDEIKSRRATGEATRSTVAYTALSPLDFQTSDEEGGIKKFIGIDS